jgi:hypothetical protein
MATEFQFSLGLGYSLVRREDADDGDCFPDAFG